MHGELLLFSGSAHPELAKKVAGILGQPLGDLEVKKFADGETYTVLNETVRGRDVFIIQPTCKPQNDHIMELLIIIDAMRRSSAGRIHAVIPWYGYSRQDRQAKAREPITAKLVANMLSAAGADHIITIDLHSGQTQGFFDFPLDHLYGLPIMAEYLRAKRLAQPVIVSPDVGGAKRASKLAALMHCDIAVVYKRRPQQNVAEAQILMGDVVGKDVIIADDIIDTGGTIVEAVNICRRNGARSVMVCATHAVFSGPCIERLTALQATEVIVTDTIPLAAEQRFPKLTILSIAPLIAEAIQRIHDEMPLTPLFEQRKDHG
ncbi:MAG: ribose-phosphate pyrophosphokinase [Nanoarchaeota archaeon]